MIVDGPKSPIAETSLAVYFRGRLIEYAERLKPPPHADTCWYLGNLLVRFGRSERLFSYEDNGYSLRPLALLYGDAREASNDRERCLLLQQLGDMALFLGALFPESFSRRGIRKNYVVGMGGGAYDYLAENARHSRHIFSELASTFPRMLEMVAHAGSRPGDLGIEEVMALYQRWLEQGDPLVGRQLQAIGIDLSGTDSLQ
jgi:hypothetical protein